MYDDPGLFLDALLVAALASWLGYLLFTEWRRAWRQGVMDAATLLGGLAIISFIWFLAWMVTEGAVPYGLWALAAAGACVSAAFTVGKTRH